VGTFVVSLPPPDVKRASARLFPLGSPPLLDWAVVLRLRLLLKFPPSGHLLSSKFWPSSLRDWEVELWLGNLFLRLDIYCQPCSGRHLCVTGRTLARQSAPLLNIYCQSGLWPSFLRDRVVVLWLGNLFHSSISAGRAHPPPHQPLRFLSFHYSTARARGRCCRSCSRILLRSTPHAGSS
jgi:hypothetical protein